MVTDNELPDRVQLSLRFDEALRRQIESAANRSLRSMNSEIVWRLRESLKQTAEGACTS